MSVCPFCKATAASSSAACTRCGKLASDHPSISAAAGRTLSDDFEDEPDGELVLGSGGHVGAGDVAASYGGGGMTFDDDFDDGPKGGDLELDLPPAAPGARGTAPPASKGTGGRTSASGVPDLDLPPPSSRKTSGRPSAPAAPAATPPRAPARTSGTQSAAAGTQAPTTSPAAPAADAHSSDASAGPSRQASMQVSTPGQTAPASPPVAAAPAKPSAAASIAKYPPPPHAVWEAPIYACKVLWRQLELRQDLESLRRRRSPDVPLYEAALGAYEKKPFNVGLALTLAAMAIATFIFFLPVILRFIRAPD